MENYYGLILAGGRGTRFWPRSRRRHAKQVLTIMGERSLIQSTVDRLTPLIPPERLWVLTNDHLRDEIMRQQIKMAADCPAMAGVINNQTVLGCDASYLFQLL